MKTDNDPKKTSFLLNSGFPQVPLLDSHSDIKQYCEGRLNQHARNSPSKASQLSDNNPNNYLPSS